MTSYVFDSGPFIVLFTNYYRSRFPTLWEQFSGLIEQERITSTREVFNELTSRNDDLAAWCRTEKHLFPSSSRNELLIVNRIFEVQHFQQMIRKRARLEGRPVADPFVVARAECLPDACVVSTEKNSPNAAKIPNVCKHFGIECIDLEGFMTREKWKF